MPRTIFDTCKPRPDVLSGSTRDEQFAAVLAHVVNGTAPDEYARPEIFFAHTHPTHGLKTLLQAVCERLNGQGSMASIIRLTTQFGGGKTHALIALVHAVRGMQGVANTAAFVDPALLPKGKVRVAALDGDNSDPTNGLTLEPGLFAYTLWGELAYRLAGREGYERVRKSDEKHVAPGAETLRELFGGEPVLIMMDEVAEYLRRAEAAHAGASKQFAVFLQALASAVESAGNAALVMTLAVSQSAGAVDAYQAENEFAQRSFEEAEKVLARKSTQLNPTDENETAAVIRTRLFASTDIAAASEAFSAYQKVWQANLTLLPQDVDSPGMREQFLAAYPFHPETFSVLEKKTASLSTFHRTRGMLRLLARTVYWLWQKKPADAFVIHPHHIDPGFGKIRDEITDRLKQEAYIAPLKADIAALPDDPDKALAEQLDAKNYAGQTPITQYIARTTFLHTLAYGEGAQGVSPDELRFSVCSPAADPSFIEQARKAFVAESIYLDDRPNAPMRFMTEPNLNQVIRRETTDVKPHEIREALLQHVQKIFEHGHFEFKRFPAEPYEVPDEVGNGNPVLALIDYESLVVDGEPDGVPDLIRRLFLYRNAEEDHRRLKNNVVFLVADLRLKDNMEARAARRLALARIVEKRLSALAEHQQKKVKGDEAESGNSLAIAVQQCFRHLFFPSAHRMYNAPMDLEIGYASIDIPTTAASPGNGQKYVEEALEKLKLASAMNPPQANFVRDKTQLKMKGEISTADLRNEFRRSPKLPILLEDSPFTLCVRKGIEQGVFIYREDNQLWGPGDVLAGIHVSDNAFVHTMEDAKAKDLWPRPEPLGVRLRAIPPSVAKRGSVELSLAISGGRPPYTIKANEPSLLRANTHGTTFASTVTPEQTVRYEVEVEDRAGVTRRADAAVTVVGTQEKVIELEEPEDRATEQDPSPPKPPKSTVREFQAEGTLTTALADIWKQARAASCTHIDKITISLYDAPSTWKVHGPMATEKSAEIACRFDATMSNEGVRKLTVHYDGEVTKATPVKSFLEPLLKTMPEKNFESTYTLAFADGLALDGNVPEKLAENLGRMGGGEAFVTAWASAPASAARAAEA